MSDIRFVILEDALDEMNKGAYIRGISRILYIFVEIIMAFTPRTFCVVWKSESHTQHMLKPSLCSCGNIDSMGICENWSCILAESEMDKFPGRQRGANPLFLAKVIRFGKTDTPGQKLSVLVKATTKYICSLLILVDCFFSNIVNWIKREVKGCRKGKFGIAWWY